MRRSGSGLLAGAAALALGTAVAGGPSSPEGDERLPMAELERLAEVYSRIKRDYVEEVPDEALFRAAIRGMLSELDDHSDYLDDEALTELREGTRGEFGGVGLELSRDGDLIRVVAPIDGTPASRAGLRAGDILLEVDGQGIRGDSLSDVTRRLRGEAGTSVAVTVLREDNGSSREQFRLEREIIQVDSVSSRLLEPGFGYVRISRFQERTASDLLEAVEELAEASGGALDGLVLDLRNNPGGILHAAISVADAFLSGGRIVSTEGRVPDAQRVFEAGLGDVSYASPMAVLINRGSASGSEIVAGALQDHGRAVVMGQPTYGKGSVQSVLPLNGDAMKLTTARYLTPQGRSIQDDGIEPDIRVEALRLAEAEPEDALAEAGVTDPEAAAILAEEHEDEEAADASLARDDYLLYQALSLLKGLHVVERR